MRILLTDGNERSTLAVARDLSRAGHTVTAGQPSRSSLAGSSRSVQGTFVYPDPAVEPDAFLDCLGRKARETRAEILIPMSDLTSSLLAGRRKGFEPRLVVLQADREVWDRTADKAGILTVAERSGLAVPRTVMTDTGADVPRLPEDFFPAVLKARRSGFWVKGRWVKTRVRHVPTLNDLPDAMKDLQPAEPPYLLQEQVTGPGLGIFILLREGRIAAAFAHRRIREKPPAGGVSTFCESIPLPEDLFEKTTGFLRALEWEGVAMVEFKEDVRDGRAKLMEVNGRFWGSLQLAISAGVRFPSLLVRSVAERDIPPVTEYRPAKLQWILGDLDHVLAVVRGRKPLHARGAVRVKSAAGFLSCLRPGVAHQVFSLRDPGPWVHEVGEYVRDLLPRGGGGAGK